MAFSPPPRKNHKQARPLFLEALEDRSTPSAAGLINADLLPVNQDAYLPDHILVQFEDGERDWTSFSLLEGTYASQHLDLVDGLYRVEVSETVPLQEALAAYDASELVAEATLDYLLGTSAFVDDPRYGSQWGLENANDADVDAEGAWEVTTGSHKVVVAVLDTGIDYKHQDLYANIWLNQGEIPASRLANLVDVDGDGLITLLDLNDSSNQGRWKITDLNNNGYIDADDLLKPMTLTPQKQDTGWGGWEDGRSQDGNSFIDDIAGWNFVANNNRPFDDNGHGTHMAGIIGAMSNNGVGVAGVNWNVQMMPAKWMNQLGQGSIGHYVMALSYAIGNGAKISNNSWSGASYSNLLYSAMDNARAQGHLIVAAAGNNGKNTDGNPAYPAGFNLDNIVSVAATTSSGALASYSNYGIITVDLAAPGSGIWSTRPHNSYRSSSGTSMATPFVTGAMSLVWSLHPDWTYQQVIDQVFNSVDKVSGLQGKTATGGRLNVATAVEGAAPSDKAAPRVVSTVASGPTSGTFNKVRVTFSEAINPASFTTGRASLVKPGGQSVAIAGVQAVAGSNNKQFDVTFSTQSAPGTYTFSISSGVTDLAGNSLAANQSVFEITRLFDYSSGSKVSIVDKQAVSSTIVVGDNVSIEKLEVKFDIDHTYDGDLYIHLQGPDGTDITLVYRRGRSGNDFKGTVLSDGASLSTLQGSAPFSGSFRPEQSLSTFAGKNAQGMWKLWIEDQAWGDQGRLNSWELKITAATGTLTGGTIQSLASSEDTSIQPGNSLAAPVVIDLLASSPLPVFGREQMEVTQTLLAWQDAGTTPTTPDDSHLQSYLASFPQGADPQPVQQDNSTPRRRPLALYPEPVPSEESEEDSTQPETDEPSSEENPPEENPSEESKEKAPPGEEESTPPDDQEA